MEFDIENVRSKFDQHLRLQGNRNILFSGRFGSGKTYFLTNYFDNATDLIAINLFPVNYSVAGNKDVFELIKYDILFSLLEQDVDVDKVTIPFSFTFPEFIKGNKWDVFNTFLASIPKLGKAFGEASKKLQILAKRFEDFHKNIQVDEERTAIDFLLKIKDGEHTLNEEDFYTQFINSLLDDLRSSSNKKLYLVIDDLDRLDPDHIFRILNVFSAHADTGQGISKFDFDGMVLVGDVRNINSLFCHRYGSLADFDGYLDKFFSQEIFHFNNEDSLISKLDQVLSLLKTNLNVVLFREGSSNQIATVVKSLLIRFMDNGHVTVRMLVNRLDAVFVYNNSEKVDGMFNGFFRKGSLNILLSCEFLCWILGGYDHLLNALRQLTTSNIDLTIGEVNAILGDSLLVLSSPSDSHFNKSVLKYTDGQRTFEFIVSKDFNRDVLYVESVTITDSITGGVNERINERMVFEYFEKALLKLGQTGLIDRKYRNAV